MTGQLLVATLIAACPILAQAPDAMTPTTPAAVKDLLQSQEPPQLAWGSYLAAQNRYQMFIPRITALLRHEHRYVQLAAVDALMQLGADVLPDNLSGLRIGGRLDPILVLLSRNPKRYAPVLMSMLDEPLSDGAWIAVNSILFTDPPPGFAARLLREWRVQITVAVEDGPHVFSDWSGGAILVLKDEGDRSGFPPLWRYIVHECPWRGRDAVIGAGPHPACFVRRSVGQNGLVGVDLPQRDRYLEDYLQSLSGVRVPDSYVTFHWTDAASYETDAGNLVAQFRKCLTEMRQVLTEKGLLKPGEPADGPPPEIRVEDSRHDKRVPLPVISWRF